MREKRATLSLKSGQGTDDVYNVKWPYYKLLKFLDKYTIVTAKATTSNLKVSLNFKSIRLQLFPDAIQIILSCHATAPSGELK